MKIDSIMETIDLKHYLTENELQIGISQNTKHNLKLKIFKIQLSVQIHCQEILIADYTYEFLFTVDNMHDFLKPTEDDRTVFEGQLIGTLMGIAYSTMRGLLYSKFADTKLNGLILPIINPNVLLKNKITSQQKS